MKKQLPPHPSLEQLKNQAKTLLRNFRAGDSAALSQIQEHHPRWRRPNEQALRSAQLTLSDAQLAVANEYGFATWAKLKQHVEHLKPAPSDASVRELRQAAGRGDLELLNRLLDANPALINEAGGSGVRTALHDAVGAGKEAAVKLLLDRGADPNIRCEGDNAMPLHFACEKQNFPIIRLLVEHGADTLGEGDYHELGIIGWATAWDYVPDANREIIDYLLAHGARHNIFSAVSMGEVEEIRRLAAKGADLDRRMDLGNRRRMPVHLAVVKKQPAALTALLDLGARIESLDEAGFTALDYAALRGEHAMAKTLLDRGAKVRLPAAIALQRTRDAEQLLRRDPDCLKPGNRWGTLIIRAAEVSSGEVVEALIRAGASVDVRDNPQTAVDLTYGYTALHAAAFRGNRGAVEVLLKHGARVGVREEKWHGTPAGWAFYAGHRELAELILRGDVDLMEAVDCGLTERVRAILAQNPELLERPLGAYPLYPLYAEGWYTPLVFAVARGQIEVVRLLLELGADGAARTPDGRGLEEFARGSGQEEIAVLFAGRAG